MGENDSLDNPIPPEKEKSFIEKAIDNISRSITDTTTESDLLSAIQANNLTLLEIVKALSPEISSEDFPGTYTYTELLPNFGDDIEQNFIGDTIIVSEIIQLDIGAIKDMNLMSSDRVAYLGSTTPPCTLKLHSVNSDPIALRAGLIIKTSGFSKFYTSVKNINSNLAYQPRLIVLKGTSLELTNKPFPFAWFDNAGGGGDGSTVHEPALIDSVTNRLSVDINTIPTVTIQDGGNVISIDDGGGSITVNANISSPLPVTDAGISLSIDDGGNVISVEDSITAHTMIKKTIDWSGAITASDLWTPTTGKRFNLSDLIIGINADCVVTIFDETDTTANRIFKQEFIDNSGLAHSFRIPIKSSAINQDLKITASAAGGYITAFGFETT